MVDQLLEAVANEAVRHGLLESSLAQLKHEAFAKVTCADAWWVEILDNAEHLLELSWSVERKILELRIDLFSDVGDGFVDADQDIVQRTREIAVFVDVSDELLSEELLAW